MDRSVYKCAYCLQFCLADIRDLDNVKLIRIVCSFSSSNDSDSGRSRQYLDEENFLSISILYPVK